MNRTKQISASVYSCAMVIFLLASPLASESYAQTCVGGNPRICVDFFGGGNPQHPADFSVSGNNLILKKAALNWRVWSQVSESDTTPADFGSITLNPSVPANDFKVEILNGTGGAGAANVKAIILNATGFTGYSSIEGGSISGNLTGALTGGLTVVQDAGGNGGELTMTIGGDVSGAITVPVVKGLTINGDLLANLTVSERVLAPGLDIDGNVGASVVISIADMSSTDVEIGTAGLQFEGDLDLLNGIPVNSSSVTILSDIGSATSTPQIDLHNGSVNGRLECLGDNAGNIVNGGDIKIMVTRASGAGNAFSGTATFGLIRLTAHVNTTSSADLNGTFHTTTDVDGDILVSGDVGKDGKIWIEGDLLGSTFTFSEVFVEGNVAGDIVIDGTVGENGFVYLDGTVSGRVTVVSDMDGLIDIDGDVTGDVDIDGSLNGLVELWAALAGRGRILVDGLSPGNITIHKQTDSLTLIHMLEGIDIGGKIIINRDAENLNAGGAIHVGPESLIGSPSVTFDGAINIRAEAETGNGGDLTGSIRVVECHSNSTDLDICIHGGDGGENVSIQQTDCTQQVEWSCGS